MFESIKCVLKLDLLNIDIKAAFSCCKHEEEQPDFIFLLRPTAHTGRSQGMTHLALPLDRNHRIRPQNKVDSLFTVLETDPRVQQKGEVMQRKCKHEL